MHTVRNRIASRSPSTSSSLADFKPPTPRSSHKELTRLLRTGAPSAEQARLPNLAGPALALPASPAMAEGALGAMVMAVPVHVAEPESRPEGRPQKRRNPKGKKARKAASRKAAGAAAVSPRKAKARGGKRRGSEPICHLLPPAEPVAPTPATPRAAPAEHRLPEVEFEAMLALCLQAEPALALMLPSRPEPLVLEALPEGPKLESEALIEAEPALAKGSAPASMPEPLVELPASLPTSPPARLPEPLREPAASALAAIADAPPLPLPRSRALVPARRQGLVDVIAFLLRDSGRRLARWSARRQKSRAERDLIRSAEVRHQALLSELQALDMLRQNRG